MKGKHFAFAGLISVLLTLVIAPTSTQQGVSNYDPWNDINDDGKIDIMDIASVAIKFGTTGTPINKTALLLELQERIDALNASLLKLQSLLKLDLPEFVILDAIPGRQFFDVRVIFWNIGHKDAQDVAIRFNLTALENEWVKLIGNTTIPSLKAGEIGRILVPWTEIRQGISGLYTWHIEISISCIEGVTKQDVAEREGAL